MPLDVLRIRPKLAENELGTNLILFDPRSVKKHQALATAIVTDGKDALDGRGECQVLSNLWKKGFPFVPAGVG